MMGKVDLGEVWFGSRKKADVDEFSELLLRNGIPIVRRLRVEGYQVAVAPVPELKIPPLVNESPNR
jgi:hypothetical protein